MGKEQFKNPRKSDKNLLSARETTLLQLAAEGHTTKDMAKILLISEPTVETHRSNILKKLQVKNITEAVAHSLRNNFIE